MRDGDVLTGYALEYTDTVWISDSAVWDLSEAPVGRKRKCEIGLLNDSLGIYRIIDRGGVEYFHQSDEGIYALGFENNLWRADFDTEEAYLLQGMTFGSVHSDEFKAHGVYCDKQRYAMRGESHLAADASGTLILPEGDTLADVLRTHSRRVYHSRYFPRDSVAAAIGDEEYAEAVDSLKLNILDLRRWYAPGYRYPVMEMRTLIRQSDGAVLQHETFYTPVDAMNDVEGDYANEELREQLRRRAANSGNDAGTDGTRPDAPTLDYKFTQNPDDRSVTIEYASATGANIEFILADAMGIVYDSYRRQCAPGESGSITISYDAATGSGSYVVYICTDDSRYAEKFHR